MTSTLIATRHTTTNIVDALGTEFLLTTFGVRPQLVGAVNDDVSLVEIGLKSLDGFVACRAMRNAEDECLARSIRFKTLTELLVIVLVDYPFLYTDFLGFIVQLVDMLLTCLSISNQQSAQSLTDAGSSSSSLLTWIVEVYFCSMLGIQ